MSAKKNAPPPPEQEEAGTGEVSIDLRRTKVVPKWIEEVVAASYAMDHEDARSVGALGFMHRISCQSHLALLAGKARR